MKTHFFKLMILFLCGLTVLSCKKEHELSNADEIQLDDITLNFNNGAQSQLLEIPISEKSNGWHIYSPSQDVWLTQEIIPGRSSIYVYVDGNTSGEARSSYIVIRSKNYTQKINVHQDSEGGINLSQTYVPVRYLNSTSVINILNFDELTDITATVAEEGTQSWLSIFTENEKINLHVTINELTTAREALITVSAKRKISGETVTSFINLYQGRGGMTPYIIDIPDFSESNVYKVMDGNKQVAQITKEFLRSVGLVNAQAIVIYPVENDVVALNKGYVAQIVLENTDLTDATFNYQAPVGAVHGGTVSFNITENNISGYVVGTEANPVTKVYMPGDVGMGPEEVPGSKATTVEPHLIVDARNSESNTYPIVKIGAQYWMGKNLNTVYYNSNKSFAAIPTNKNANVPNYSVYQYVDGESTAPQAITNRARYGLYYSYLAIGGFDNLGLAGVSQENDVIADNISPTGWTVPTVDQALSLRTYIGVGNMGRLRKFIDYTTGNQSFPTTRTDDDITGFAAPNGSYRNSDTGWAGLGAVNGAWYLTRSLQSTSNVKIFHMNDVLNGGSSLTSRNYTIRSLNATSIQTSDN